MSDATHRSICYSVDREVWLWEVNVPNPYPGLLPDGRASILEQWVTRSGAAFRRKSAERAMARAERRIERSIAKAAKV